MELIADILLGAGAIGAGLYCQVLSRRLKAFNQLETGMGGAIAVMSAQVDDLTRALETARKTAADSERKLDDMTGRAEGAARKLELMLASLHDLPDEDRTDAGGPASEGGATQGGATESGARRMRVLRRRGHADPLEAAE